MFAAASTDQAYTRPENFWYECLVSLNAAVYFAFVSILRFHREVSEKTIINAIILGGPEILKVHYHNLLSWSWHIWVRVDTGYLIFKREAHMEKG